MRVSPRVRKWLTGPRADPSVRWRVLSEVEGRSPNDPRVRAARGAIGRTGWAAEILSRQLPGGFWDNSRELNRPKYLATFWMFLILRDLGVTLEEPRMRQTCDLLVERASRDDGGFSFWEESHFCMTGQIAESLIRLGYEDCGRIREALDWIVHAQKADGGWHCFPSPKGTLDCWQGLSAFAAFPRDQWGSRIRRTVERGAEFYLKRHLYREGRSRYSPWFRFHSPAHYYYDVLVGLEVLTALGYGKDARLVEGVELLRKKRRPDGRWSVAPAHPDVEGRVKQEYTRYEPHWPISFSLETAGKPSKLVTLRALRVLQRIDDTASTEKAPIHRRVSTQRTHGRREPI